VTKKIAEMEEALKSKNSYINNFRRSEVVAASTMKEAEDEHKPRGYDNINEMDDESADRSEYCQKCKYESRWCKHRKPRDDNKLQQAGALITSQTLGWRSAYDDLTFGQNRSGVCWRTFHDDGHL